MAFADLMLGSVSLPIYIYSFGRSFQLWKGGWSMPLSSCYIIVDIFFSQASLISAAFMSGERFYAIYWPFKHRTLTIRAYRIIIVAVWAMPPYHHRLEYIIFLVFIQTFYVFLDAIFHDYNIHHMLL